MLGPVIWPQEASWPLIGPLSLDANGAVNGAVKGAVRSAVNGAVKGAVKGPLTGENAFCVRVAPIFGPRGGVTLTGGGRSLRHVSGPLTGPITGPWTSSVRETRRRILKKENPETKNQKLTAHLVLGVVCVGGGPFFCRFLKGIHGAHAQHHRHRLSGGKEHAHANSGAARRCPTKSSGEFSANRPHLGAWRQVRERKHMLPTQSGLAPRMRRQGGATLSCLSRISVQVKVAVNVILNVRTYKPTHG